MFTENKRQEVIGTRYFLVPYYDGAKSFYGKAEVFTGIVLMAKDCIVSTSSPTKQTLYSFGEPVCYIEQGKLHLLYTYNFSATTLRHVKEFLKQHGLRAENKKQIDKDYFNKIVTVPYPDGLYYNK